MIVSWRRRRAKIAEAAACEPSPSVQRLCDANERRRRRADQYQRDLRVLSGGGAGSRAPPLPPPNIIDVRRLDSGARRRPGGGRYGARTPATCCTHTHTHELGSPRAVCYCKWRNFLALILDLAPRHCKPSCRRRKAIITRRGIRRRFVRGARPADKTRPRAAAADQYAPVTTCRGMRRRNKLRLARAAPQLGRPGQLCNVDTVWFVAMRTNCARRVRVREAPPSGSSRARRAPEKWSPSLSLSLSLFGPNCASARTCKAPSGSRRRGSAAALSRAAR